MSTNILGYRINVTQLPHVHALLREYRTEALAAVTVEAAKTAAKIACRIFDERTLAGDDKVDAVPLSLAMKTLEEAMTKKTRDPNDYSCSLTILPHDVCTLLLFHAECSLYHEIAAKRFPEYHYQNSSDRPKRYSKAEWEERERTWQQAFAPSWTPSVAGYTQELVTNVRHLNPPISQHLPTVWKRALELARDDYIDAFQRRNLFKPSEYDQDDWSKQMSMVMQAAKWKTTHEGKEWLKEHALSIAKKLKHDLTYGDLTR